ncbi:MAG: bifunctional UDP-N-acetylmuramoyl-tripeptide:D-alanyl-D-alanine ligase/alanine racemase [Bacteroidota bacterium]
MFPISELIKIIKAIPYGNFDSEQIVVELHTDSRQMATTSNSLFFALITRRNDGHKFISELYQKGVLNFVVSSLPEDFENIFPEACFLLVKDTLVALQMLSAAHRKKFNFPVIGISGSNGKTIIKEWLYFLLNEDKRIVKSPKSYNSQIGVPLSVWQMKAEDELGIFEAGISEPGEMDKLQTIIQPTIGVFTNIGSAHDENFINTGQKVGEKLKLFTHVKVLIFCKDHPEISEKLFSSPNMRDITTFSWSYKGNADLIIRRVEKMQQYTSIWANFHEKEINIQIPFTDEASIENAIHCWAVLLYLNYNQEVIQQRMAKLSSVAMRLEMKEGINNCSVINDSYNSDVKSLSIALDFLHQQKQHQKKTVILSDILQSGKNEYELYEEVAGLLKQNHVNRIIGIGKAISMHSKSFNMIENTFYHSTEDFLQQFSLSEFNNEVILVKGARLFEFEKISKALQQKAHETVLEINLNALIYNLNHYRSKLKPTTKMMVMVKAFSYGSGSFEIANALQFHRVDYLAVAYADEGVELRASGINLPIMVMNPEEQSFDTIIKHKLEPEIYSFRVFELLIESMDRIYSSTEQTVNIHIKLDTGMHRLGFEENDIPELINRLKKHSNIHVQSVFTHLAASDEAEQDDFTHNQIQNFSNLCQQLYKGIHQDFLRHILNSSGISRFPEAQFEMVRLGLGLYGIASEDNEQKLLQNVSTLRTRISQIKNIPKGETIGYSRKGKAEKNLRIATIPIGYADGFNRQLGNGNGYVLINGKHAKTVGNICMDMCMIDITDVSCNENDEVIIFGNNLTVNQVANMLHTIPYEILTGISRRVKRIYFQE